jgi:hypothetical protein
MDPPPAMLQSSGPSSGPCRATFWLDRYTCRNDSSTCRIGENTLVSPGSYRQLCMGLHPASSSMFGSPSCFPCANHRTSKPARVRRWDVPRSVRPLGFEQPQDGVRAFVLLSSERMRTNRPPALADHDDRIHGTSARPVSRTNPPATAKRIVTGPAERKRTVGTRTIETMPTLTWIRPMTRSVREIANVTTVNALWLPEPFE